MSKVKPLIDQTPNLVKPKVRKLVPAPYVRGPGRQVIRVPSVIQQASGTRDPDAIYGTRRGKRNRRNSGVSNRNRVSHPTYADLIREARKNLSAAAGSRFSKGRNRYEAKCACMGKCECPKTIQHGIVGPKDLLTLLEKVTGKPTK